MSQKIVNRYTEQRQGWRAPVIELADGRKISLDDAGQVFYRYPGGRADYWPPTGRVYERKWRAELGG